MCKFRWFDRLESVWKREKRVRKIYVGMCLSEWVSEWVKNRDNVSESESLTERQEKKKECVCERERERESMRMLSNLKGTNENIDKKWATARLRQRLNNITCLNICTFADRLLASSTTTSFSLFINFSESNIVSSAMSSRDVRSSFLEPEKHETNFWGFFLHLPFRHAVTASLCIFEGLSLFVASRVRSLKMIQCRKSMHKPDVTTLLLSFGFWLASHFYRDILTIFNHRFLRIYDNSPSS